MPGSLLHIGDYGAASVYGGPRDPGPDRSDGGQDNSALRRIRPGRSTWTKSSQAGYATAWPQFPQNMSSAASGEPQFPQALAIVSALLRPPCSEEYTRGAYDPE